jgi:hypothetical protein
MAQDSGKDRWKTVRYIASFCFALVCGFLMWSAWRDGDPEFDVLSLAGFVLIGSLFGYMLWLVLQVDSDKEAALAEDDSTLQALGIRDDDKPE